MDLGLLVFGIQLDFVKDVVDQENECVLMKNILN